ncbi:MAG: hypothetical protein EAX96_16150 [Candidatus Lokiarchaeota archaeon]|nr:hypothetical protein [Candidatus Lokiarchaeota archaeon]
MLGKCNYYDFCSPNERQIEGKSEQYCIGACELCLKFKRLESIKIKENLNPYEKINRIVVTISSEVHNILNKNVNIAIFDSDSNLLHSDSNIKDSEISYLKSYIRNNVDGMEIGERLISSYDDRIFGLYRVIEKALIVLFIKEGFEEEYISLNVQVDKYSTEIQEAVEMFKDHFLVYHEFSLDTGSQSIVEIFNSLKSKIEQNLTAIEIAEYMEKARDEIALIFAWHPVLYEITIFARDKLKKYPISRSLDKSDKAALLEYLENWKNRLYIKT